MRVKGLEPPCREALDPKSSVSTNFTTPARTFPERGCKYRFYFKIDMFWLKINVKAIPQKKMGIFRTSAYLSYPYWLVLQPNIFYEKY